MKEPQHLQGKSRRLPSSADKEVAAAPRGAPVTQVAGAIPTDISRLTPDHVLTLQRTIGNQAVARLLGRNTPNGGATAQQVSTTPAAVPLVQRKANTTGLPDRLKANVEQLGGVALDDVKVHYRSPKAAQIGAAAYARGNEIHVAPQREQHLAHEAWHLVQQRQGRVPPRIQAKGLQLNDDPHLEREADLMAVKAQQMTPAQGEIAPIKPPSTNRAAGGPPVIQPVWEDVTEVKEYKDGKNWIEVETIWRNLEVPMSDDYDWNLYYSEQDGILKAPCYDDGTEGDLEPVRGTDRNFAKMFKRKMDTDFPWLVYDPNAGIKKRGGGGGGGRTVASGDAKFHVTGLTDSPNDQLLMEYLQSRDDYEPKPKKSTPFTNRLPHGTNVPSLHSTLPVAPPGSTAKDDKDTREDIPKKYKGKGLESGNTVKGYFNAALLDQWAGERKTDSNPSQTAMARYKGTVVDEKKGSPTLTAKAFGFNPVVGGKGWEWLHLRAYSMGGASEGTPQLPDNLVLGTWHANSAHLAIETAAKWVANKNPNETFLFEATPKLVPGTPIADHIIYTIGTSEQRFMQFEIDALTRTRPTSADADYWKAIMAARLLSYDDAGRTMEKIDKSNNTSLTTTFDEVPQSPTHYSHFDELSDDEIVDSDWDTVKQTKYANKSKKRRYRDKHEAPDDVTHVDDLPGKEMVVDQPNLSNFFPPTETTRLREVIAQTGQRGQLFSTSKGTRHVFMGTRPGKKGAKRQYVFRDAPKGITKKTNRVVDTRKLKYRNKDRRLRSKLNKTPIKTPLKKKKKKTV
jgi:hypothetical protein